MLGKLLKYEFKATSKMLLPLYGVIIALTLINRIFLEDTFQSASTNASFEWVKALILVGYILILIASGIITTIIIILRFYKNMLKDEGYLMNTLPVSTESNILSKLIAAVSWLIIAQIVIILSVMIIIPGNYGFEGVSSMYGWFDSYVDMNNLMITSLLLSMIDMIKKILILYASMCIGQLAKKSKVFCSFVAFIGIKFIVSIINGIVGISSSNRYISVFTESISEVSILPSVVTSIIIIVLLFFVCSKILKEKLNLE